MDMKFPETFASFSAWSGTFHPLSTLSSSVGDSSDFVGSSLLCKHHVSTENSSQHIDPTEPQAQALAQPVPFTKDGTARPAYDSVVVDLPPGFPCAPP